MVNRKKTVGNHYVSLISTDDEHHTFRPVRFQASSDV